MIITKHPNELRQIIHDIDLKVLSECKEDRSLAQTSLLIHVIAKDIETRRINKTNWNIHIDLFKIFSAVCISYRHKNVNQIINSIEKHLPDKTELSLELDYNKYDLVFSINPFSFL